MEERTQQHLRRAERFRRIARGMLQQAQTGQSPGPPLDWAVVITFYAALQFVSALRWEKERWEAKTHDDLRETADRFHQLRPHRRTYRRLLDQSWQARYAPEYQVSVADVEPWIGEDLEAIRGAVRLTLQLPPP